MDWVQVITIAGSAAGGALSTIALLKWVRRDADTVEITGQPLKVTFSETFATRAQCQADNDEVKRRLGGHDAEINSIWNKMRDEHTSIRTKIQEEAIAIRREVDSRFADILRALGRIEGRLKEKDDQ